MNNPRGITEAGRDIYTVNFADYLPAALKHDPKMRAIAEAVTEKALTVSGEIENVLIYSRIDELPEELIDILAYDMHVDWYDYSFPLKVKRDILKSSVKVHKRMGTKYAVETAIQAIYPESRIEEWFDYGGKPFHFKVILNAGDRNLEIDLDDVVKKVNMYKRLSAHMDSINIERTKRARICIGYSQERFVKINYRIDPYQKEVKSKIEIKIAIHGLRHIQIHYPICKQETETR